MVCHEFNFVLLNCCVNVFSRKPRELNVKEKNRIKSSFGYESAVLLSPIEHDRCQFHNLYQLCFVSLNSCICTDVLRYSTDNEIDSRCSMSRNSDDRFRSEFHNN